MHQPLIEVMEPVLILYVWKADKSSIKYADGSAVKIIGVVILVNELIAKNESWVGGSLDIE